MSTEPVVDLIDPPGDGRIQCWCCGTVDAPDRMVHLGNHPEVHLCLRCAHFVHKQAWEIEDGGKRGPAVLARSRFRSLRAGVVRRGWHQNRFIGGKLRWLGRYLP
ncbi:hypothetical protein [Leekyejoonella antrihumi]|uniref:Uncharacterized protein n=1 Tax=Leekyejoonella antrihumi TaxID=1660198 RepID=A0A563E3J9_9MICO|nr:hypothetical protein [Leekyejoonella antrihumi]TWP36823.1 hypothetical protein FGL98_08695 [Leekyejoonella antrihumi]